MSNNPNAKFPNSKKATYRCQPQKSLFEVTQKDDFLVRNPLGNASHKWVEGLQRLLLEKGLENIGFNMFARCGGQLSCLGWIRIECRNGTCNCRLSYLSLSRLGAQDARFQAMNRQLAILHYIASEYIEKANKGDIDIPLAIPLSAEMPWLSLIEVPSPLSERCSCCRRLAGGEFGLDSIMGRLLEASGAGVGLKLALASRNPRGTGRS